MPSALPSPPHPWHARGAWLLTLTPISLSCWLLAARFLADGETLFSGVLLFLPLVLVLNPNPWVVWVFRVVLVAGGALWAVTAWQIMQDAWTAGEPVPRVVGVVWGIAGFTLLSVLAFETRALKRYFQRSRGQ